MDQAFNDADLQQKALVRVNTMRQGRRDFEEFLADFDSALIDAGGLLWDNTQKKALLDTAVNQTLLEGTVGTEQPATYEEYCNQLRRINHQQRRIARLAYRGRNTPSILPYTEKGTSPAGLDAMDWESTAAQVAALQGQLDALRTKGSQRPRRATRISDAELQRRRTEKRCFRCGSEKHIARECSMLPPRRPTQVAVAQPLSDSRESEEPEDGESEKE